MLFIEKGKTGGAYRFRDVCMSCDASILDSRLRFFLVM